MQNNNISCFEYNTVLWLAATMVPRFIQPNDTLCKRTGTTTLHHDRQKQRAMEAGAHNIVAEELRKAREQALCSARRAYQVIVLLWLICICAPRKRRRCARSAADASESLRQGRHGSCTRGARLGKFAVSTDRCRRYTLGLIIGFIHRQSLGPNGSWN